MCYDLVNYVRQGALIASALVLIQQTEQTCAKVKDFRQLYTKVVSDKHEDVMAKLGAILAKGIIDAGGRNVTVALQSRTGHNNMQAVVGMLVFTQYWFWYPLAHFLSLAFTPTCMVGLNADLRMPQMQFKSNARPSMYAYPPPIEERKREDREKVATAVLSITARAKRKEAKKEEKPAAAEKMDVDDDTKKDAGQEKDAKKETEKEEKEKADAKKKEEPSSEMLANPARVLRHQLRVVQPVEGARYQTVKDLRAGGVLMVRDTGDGAQQLVDWVVAHGPQKEPEEAEPEPPEPFDYVEE